MLAVLDPEGAGDLEGGLRALARRGPDGQGRWSQGPVGLGHTRLALNGGAAGAQPLHGTGWVGVVNGELYNHAELGSGRSDSEVLLHRLAMAGPPGVERARGAFAVVVWTGDRLLAVRDRFGIKPLYWSWTGRRLMLASEPRALLAMGHPARWDEAAVRAMLTHQYLLPTQTIFHGIQALEPGCWLEARPGEAPRVGRWWSWPVEAPGTAPTAEELREGVRASVAERCVADQPVACQLSGGLDSGLIAALAAERGVRTAYTVRFKGNAAWDEAEQASRVAAHLGLDHRMIELDQADLLTHLDAAVVASGGPVINTHVSAKWLLARAVRGDGHAVLLSGEGADELFWGYDHLVGAGASSPAAAGIHLLQGEALDTTEVAQAWGHVPAWLAAKAGVGWRLGRVTSVEPRGFGPLIEALGDPPAVSPTGVAAWSWARLCLAGSILQRLCDPLEMAWGVEGRMPLLDLSVSELADRIPVASRVVDGVGKHLLRRAAEPLLPPGAAWRPKHPFMAPPLELDAAVVGRLLDGAVPDFVCRRRLEQALCAVRPLPAEGRVAWDPVWLTVLSCQALAEAHGL